MEMELTISWDDNDVSKIQYGEIWTNGETKALGFDDEKGVNENFQPTPHLAEFQKDFYTWYDTGSEKLGNRLGKFTTQNGINVAWKVPRNEKTPFENAVRVKPTWLDVNAVSNSRDVYGCNGTLYT